MTKVGVTGHQRLSNSCAWDWISEQIQAELACINPPLVGITSLAIGTDQLFARIVLNVGGTVEFVMPFPSYTKAFSNADQVEFARLRALCSRTEVLPARSTDQESYLAAGKRVVDLSDLVIAVWDGQPPKGLGGTGDIVQYAIDRSRPLIHLNPDTKTLTRT
jgi:hypothetical protein